MSRLYLSIERTCLDVELSSFHWSVKFTIAESHLITVAELSSHKGMFLWSRWFVVKTDLIYWKIRYYGNVMQARQTPKLTFITTKNQKPLAIVESHFCRLIMFGQTTKLSGSGGFVSQVVGQSGWASFIQYITPSQLWIISNLAQFGRWPLLCPWWKSTYAPRHLAQEFNMLSQEYNMLKCTHMSSHEILPRGACTHHSHDGHLSMHSPISRSPVIEHLEHLALRKHVYTFSS